MSRPVAAAEIADRLARRHVGVVVGVLDLASGEQQVLARGGTGRADGSAVTADTFFEIGSITKTFTALVLATMVESGRVRLDTPVRDLLPAGVTVPARDGAEITSGTPVPAHLRVAPLAAVVRTRPVDRRDPAGQSVHHGRGVGAGEPRRTLGSGTGRVTGTARTPIWASVCSVSRCAGRREPAATRSW